MDKNLIDKGQFHTMFSMISHDNSALVDNPLESDAKHYIEQIYSIDLFDSIFNNLVVIDLF